MIQGSIPTNMPIDSKILPMVIKQKRNKNSEPGNLEYNLPFGWKKVGVRGKIINLDNKVVKTWDFHLSAPNVTKFRTTKEVRKWLNLNPNVKYDPEVTNTVPPPDYLLPTGKVQKLNKYCQP